MAAQRSPTSTRSTYDDNLVARAAWLHFVGGLTQSEVAKRLNVPITRAHRYISARQSDGLVRIFVDAKAEACVTLETELMRRFGLDMCRVAMELPETAPLPIKALSAVGGDLFMHVATAGKHRVIGVGNGRTLAASVDAMGRCAASDVRFVSVMGGLTRSFAANPYDVIHRLAQRTDAEAYLMPVPLFANSARDKQVMMAQLGIAAAMSLVEEASMVVIGVGAVNDTAGSVMASMLEGPGEAADLREAGAVAEILGQFLDADGRAVGTGYDDRVMAPPLDSLRGREVIAIAGGAIKAQAIRAALRSGILTGLIIDEATARAIVEKPEASGAEVDT